MNPAKMPQKDKDAIALMQGFRRKAGTLFRALDLDGDGVLSAEEIAGAPEVLHALITDADGCLREKNFGGPTDVPGLVRRSGIVRMLDWDGDLVITPQDIAAAPERLLLLDRDGDGQITAEDDLPDPRANIEARMPMGTPAQVLDMQQALFTRSPENSGPKLPTNNPKVQPGYMLIHEMNDRSSVQTSSRLYLMDAGGAVAHEWQTDKETPEATAAYLTHTGHLIRATSLWPYLEMEGTFPVGAHGTISIEDKDSNVLWQWTHCIEGQECLHHDLEMLPNGNILVIAWAEKTTAEMRKHGWAQQGTRERVFLDKIYEVQPDFETDAGNIVWEWSLLDHSIQNVDPSASNYGNPADHPEKIDLNWPQLDDIQFNAGQLYHVNSVSYHPEDDIIMLSSAIFSEVWAIDHSTTRKQAAGSTGGKYGRGGDVLWRWGNPQTHGAGGSDAQVLFWQHDAHFLDGNKGANGDLLVFNNGMRRTPEGAYDAQQICMGFGTGAYSDVLELLLPRDDAGNLMSGAEPTLEWSFNRNADTDFYGPFMSGASRLPNGNTIMLQSYNKRIVEVTQSGEVVMDFCVGGPGRMFRIKKYASDHPAVLALDLHQNAQ